MRKRDLAVTALIAGGVIATSPFLKQEVSPGAGTSS